MTEKKAEHPVLKALGVILGVALTVVGSWALSHWERLQAAEEAAAAVKAEKDRTAADAVLAATVAGEELETRVATAHDVNAAAVNACLDQLDDLDSELHELTRDFDRLAGAMEAFHGQRRVAAAAERVEELPRPNHDRPKIEKVPAYQALK